MIAATVYNNVVSTLEDNPTLALYMKRIYKGLRYDIEPEGFPCIMVEPVSNNETEKDMNQVKDIRMALDIIAYSYNMANPDKAIVGDADYHGILEIENDIRACLQSSYTLGGTVIDISFEPTIFGYKEFPVRGLTIPIRVLYRQNNSI